MPPKRKSSAIATTTMDSSPLPPKRIRQTLEDSAAKPAAKKTKTKTAAPAAKKTAAKKPKKKTTVKTPKIVVEDVDSEGELATKLELERQALTPLPDALKHKLRAVDAFLDSNTSPLLEREAGSNIATVDELDLLAALIILRVDYQLFGSFAEVSLDDAGEMIVARLDDWRVSVDFDRTCDLERAAQDKLAKRGTGLEEANLVEVEIEMLAAKRRQMVEDLRSAAGFKLFDELAKEASVDDSSSGERKEDETRVDDSSSGQRT